MKKKAKEQTGTAALPVVGTDTLHLLKHILSPLELEALKHPHREFEFRFNDVVIPVSTAACSQLLAICSIKIRSFSDLLQQATDQMTEGNDEIAALLKETEQQSTKGLKEYAAKLAGPVRSWIMPGDRNYYMKGVIDGLKNLNMAKA